MGPARSAITLLVDREAGETTAELSGMLRTDEAVGRTLGSGAEEGGGEGGQGEGGVTVN